MFTDTIEAGKALEMMTLISVLTEGYYSVSVLAEEAGLTPTVASARLKSLVAYGLAKYKPLEGYAKA